MASPPDHQMVVHGNAQCLGGGGDLAGHGNVGLGRCGIAGWMVVHKDQGRGRQFQRALDDFARIDRGVIDRAFGPEFVPKQDVLLVEIQGAELLSRFVGQGRANIGDQGGP